jgi:hypothetical protein
MAMQIPGIDPNKLKGGWKMVRDLIADTVGPMGLLAIAAGSFVKASAGAALNAQRMAEALKASDGAERLKQQFEQLLGSAAAAKRQVEMLAKVASGSAFTFDSLADASKNLQVLTNGALNSEKALKKVQDVAAATGAPVDTMATAVADLYNALKTGDGVEAASAQLKNMGAISQETAQRLDSLSASGVGLAATWQVVEADLNKANGAASALGGTIAGLQQQLANIQQGSDTKIGEMMAAGEKAGLRAAIGFKKFTAAVEEANAGPWSAFILAINSVKEAVGGMLGAFAETGAVKGIFQALAVVAIAALVAINYTIVSLIVGIGKFIVATGALRAAMVATGSAMRVFATLVSGTTLVASLAATAIIGIGVAAISAENNLRGLIEKMKEFTSEADKSASASVGASQNIRSPEDQKRQEDSIDQQLQTLESAKKEAQKTIEQGREKQSGVWNTISSFGFNKIEGSGMVAGGEATLASVEKRRNELMALKAKVSGADVGPDNARFEKEEAQRVQEKQIAKNARERIQSTATPQKALEMAEQQQAKANEELNAAVAARENVYKDEKRLNKTSANFAEGRDKIESARGDYFSAKESNDAAIEAGMREIRPDDAFLESLGDRKQAYLDNQRKGVVSRLQKNKSFRDNEATIEAGLPTETLSVEGFDQAGAEAVSKSGKLQAERAKREALLQERQSAQTALDLAKRQGDEAGGNDALRRLADVDLQARNLRDLDTGKQLGEAALDPLQMRGLDSKIAQAIEEEDDGKKRELKEAADIRAQQAKEAVAADTASTAAGQRKLNVQKQINALQGMEGGVGAAAEAELEPEIAQLQKKQEAMKKLVAAEEAVKAAQQGGDKGKIAEAQANYNAQRVEAMKVGYEDGDTLESVDQEVKGMNQILQIRKQQAAIEQAAAQRRRDDLMNEIKLSNQINQIRLQRTEGGMGGKGDKDRTKTERDAKLDDLKRKQGDLEKAGGVMAERDAALNAMKNAGSEDEKNAAADLAQKKKAELEALGVSGDASAGALSTRLAQNKNEQQNAKVEQVVQRKGYEDDVRIAMARTKEDYGVTRDERESGRNERRAAEDEKMKQSLKEDYEKNQGLNAGEAEQMAELETKKQRLLADDAEAGTPRIDSLTAVGGGSTGSVGPVKDIQQEIKKINEEMRSLLETIVSETQSQARMVGQYQDSPNY